MSGVVPVREITLDAQTGQLKVDSKVIVNLNITSPINVKYYLDNDYSHLNAAERKEACKLITAFYRLLAFSWEEC